jgi:hypothetical protein
MFEVIAFFVLLGALAVACKLAAQAISRPAPVPPAPCAPPPPPPPLPPGVQRLDVPATGIEAFSDVLLAGRLYEINVSGTCKYQFGDYSEFDAAYQQNMAKNFSQRHDRLLVSERPLRQCDRFIEDRATHTYSAWIEGAGTRLSFRVKDGHDYVNGGFRVDIEVLPQGTRSPSDLRREHEEREEAIRFQQVLAERQKAEQARREAEAERRVDELKRRVHHNRNFLDAEFRREYVRKNSAALLSNLRQEWTNEYDTIFSDAELIARLRNVAPEVLDFYNCRINMILDAERVQIVPISPVPAAAPPSANRQITATTMGHVSKSIQELFQFTEMFDRQSQALALDENEQAHESKLSRAIAGMAYCYKDLKRFGIDADSPEAAEMQFFQLCPPPAPTVYEELIQKLKKRKSVPPDALCERLEDLHREKIILQARRRASIRQGDDQERDDIDRRLADVRREATEIKAFLEAIKVPVEFKDRHEREQELSLEEKFIQLYSGKKRVIDYLTKEGDPQAVENVEALYAQEQARLFEQDSSYA